MINKPFRILKDKIRFYIKTSENILEQVREELITSDLWHKAVNRFNKENKPISIYENHDRTKVVGKVHNLEAKEDGLYVTAHELNYEGSKAVSDGQFDLPSIDAVLYKDKDNNIVDLEVFGISLVNSAGATDTQLVTMSKDNELEAINKIEIKQTKELKMKEELMSYFEDTEFVQNLDPSIIDKIVEVHAEYLKEKLKVGGEETEVETLERSDDGEEKEIVEEKIEEKEVVEEAKDPEEKVAMSKNAELIAMNKFEDLIAKREAEFGGKAQPTTVKEAMRLLKKLTGESGAETIAMSKVSFYGEKTIAEPIKQSKENNMRAIVGNILGVK